VSHLRAADGTILCEHEEAHPNVSQPAVVHEHDHRREHGHEHGLIDRSILRSRAGIRAVSWSLAILTVTALAQAFIYSRTLSVALLADLIHNFGDALTAVPLGLAFFFRSLRGERLAGLAVVLAIFISAMVALVQTIERFIHPRTLNHLCYLLSPGSSASSATRSPPRSAYAPDTDCKARPLLPTASTPASMDSSA